MKYGILIGSATGAAGEARSGRGIERIPLALGYRRLPVWLVSLFSRFLQRIWTALRDR